MSDAPMTADGQSRSTGVHTDALRQKAVVAGQAVADLASEARHVAVAGATELTSHAKDWVSTKSDAVKHRADDLHVSTISYVRHNPYKALAVAAGVGVLLGMMLRFRGRD